MNINAVLFDWHGTIYKHGFPPFIKKLISDLFHCGYRLGVISNSHRYGDARWIRRKLAEADLIQYFECTVSTGGFLGKTSSGCHKPHAEVYQRVADFIGVPTHKCLFLGDSYTHDVLAPRILGMNSLEVDCDVDYTKKIWEVLLNSPIHKIANLITTYLEECNGGEKYIQIRMRDLTEPLSVGETILLGMQSFLVNRFTPSVFSKEDILSNSEKNVHIYGRFIPD